MANILDYIEWRGDLPFNQSPFNEIDNLILSRVSYFSFDEIISDGEEITIKEAYKRFLKLDEEKIKYLIKGDIDLFPALAKSERFGNLILRDFINKFDAKTEKQFCAITIMIPDQTAYVSYRGTDNTLIGWKEDFNMSFMEYVPAQIDAKNYLNDIANKITCDIRVGGHSKGGNLAVYASTFCDEKIKDRIIKVYNNDGPGFFEEVIKTKEYQQNLPKIHTYIPQASIIGRMLNHEEKTTIVQSTQFGIYQHDLFNWQVMGSKFVTAYGLTENSEIIDKTLKKWLQEVSPEQREKFAVTLFEILASTDANTLSEINENKFANYKKIFESYKNLDEEGKNIINNTVKTLLNIVKENIKKSGKKDELENK